MTEWVAKGQPCRAGLGRLRLWGIGAHVTKRRPRGAWFGERHKSCARLSVSVSDHLAQHIMQNSPRLEVLHLVQGINPA